MVRFGRLMNVLVVNFLTDRLMVDALHALHHSDLLDHRLLDRVHFLLNHQPLLNWLMVVGFLFQNQTLVHRHRSDVFDRWRRQFDHLRLVR